MPKGFKAITSIIVWVLFLHGLVAILWGGVYMLREGLTLTKMAAISCSIGTVNLIFAAIVIKIRQTLE